MIGEFAASSGLATKARKQKTCGDRYYLPLAFCRLTKAYRARLIMLIITHNINDPALPVGRAMSSMTLPHFEAGRLGSAWHSSVAQNQAPCHYYGLIRIDLYRNQRPLASGQLLRT